MADLESLFQDMSYMIALDKNSLNDRITKKTHLPNIFSHEILKRQFLESDPLFLEVEKTVSNMLGFSLFYTFVDQNSQYFSKILRLFKLMISYVNDDFEITKKQNLRLLLESLNETISFGNDSNTFKFTFENFHTENMVQIIHKYNCNLKLSSHKVAVFFMDKTDYEARSKKVIKNGESNINIGDEISGKKISEVGVQRNKKGSNLKNIKKSKSLLSSENSSKPLKEKLIKEKEREHLKTVTSSENWPLSSSNVTPIERYDCEEFNNQILNLLDTLRNSVLKPLHDQFLKSKHFIRYIQWRGLGLNQNPTLDSFNIHRIIGRGGFGEVYGCHKTDTGKLFALKMQDKRRLKQKKCIKSALFERNLLAKINFPFIVNMTYCVQTNTKIIMVLDLMDGGDLSYHIYQKGCFTIEEIKFLSTEIILGLEYLHSKFILYRDLKPANVLLDRDGHIKLSDFGLAILFSEEFPPKSSVGTYGYMAPEVIEKKPYGYAVDWFSFGCLLYKAAYGYSPFRSNNDSNKTCIDRTLHDEPEYSADIDQDLNELIVLLLKKNAKERLGNHQKGYKDVKNIKFFSDVDWLKVYLKQITPPFVPPQNEINAADVVDIGNFNNSNYNKIKINEEDQMIFDQFGYINHSLWEQEIYDAIFENMNKQFLKNKNKSYLNYQKYMQQNKSKQPILYGFILRHYNVVFSHYRKKFIQLFHDRLFIGNSYQSSQSVILMKDVKEIERGPLVDVNIQVTLKLGKVYIFKFEHYFEHKLWLKELKIVFENYRQNNSTNESTENFCESANKQGGTIENSTYENTTENKH